MDYNEWLLEDRLHVIDDIIIKPRHNFKIQIIRNQYRNIVLVDLFKRLAEKYDGKIHTLNTNEKEILIDAERNFEGEEAVCAEYDDNHILIKYHPLSVCDDDWIAWYISKYIERY